VANTSKITEKQIAECLPLHPLEARILVVLTEGPAHGYRIVQEIEQRDSAWTKIFPANLYRRIRALSARGLIAHAAGSEAPRGRRSFELTGLGTAVARAEASRLRNLLADFDAADLVAQRTRR
jgi:DNA-binding PadR family transcriptional regulator